MGAGAGEGLGRWAELGRGDYPSRWAPDWSLPAIAEHVLDRDVIITS